MELISVTVHLDAGLVKIKLDELEKEKTDLGMF